MSLLLCFSWSFYAVKTQRSKNGMEAIFRPGGVRVSQKLSYFVIVKINSCQKKPIISLFFTSPLQGRKGGALPAP
jgi:hypothetical protein